MRHGSGTLSFRDTEMTSAEEEAATWSEGAAFSEPHEGEKS